MLSPEQVVCFYRIWQGDLEHIWQGDLEHPNDYFYGLVGYLTSPSLPIHKAGLRAVIGGMPSNESFSS